MWVRKVLKVTLVHKVLQEEMELLVGVVVEGLVHKVLQVKMVPE
jgi:hypothetical protein